jgi:hypothetical protein
MSELILEYPTQFTYFLGVKPTDFEKLSRKIFSVRPKIRFRPILAENKNFGYVSVPAELSAPTETVFCRVTLVVDLIIIKYGVFFFLISPGGRR